MNRKKKDSDTAVGWRTEWNLPRQIQGLKLSIERSILGSEGQEE